MAEPRTYTLTVDGVPPSGNARLHHMTRYRRCKEFSDDIAWQAARIVADHEWHQPFARARVVATIMHRSRRYWMDTDNAYMACKPVVDGLKGRLVVDDDPAHIDLQVQQAVGDWRHVTLEVTELWTEQQEDGNADHDHPLRT